MRGERAHGGEGTHKGCPYGWIIRARARGEGTHKGCPYGWILRAHTRGEGTHKGCPYGWILRAHTQGGGHPQGVPLRLDFEGAHTGGGHPRGVPLRLDFEGAHTGCPYPIQAASVGANGVWRRRCALGWSPTCEHGHELAAGRVFGGGVAGGIPPHKGGPKARPPKKAGERSEKRPVADCLGMAPATGCGATLAGDRG